MEATTGTRAIRLYEEGLIAYIYRSTSGKESEIMSQLTSGTGRKEKTRPTQCHVQGMFLVGYRHTVALLIALCILSISKRTGLAQYRGKL